VPKRKLSPKTVARIKVITQRKVLEYKRDIVRGDDFNSMKLLTMVLKNFRTEDTSPEKRKKKIENKR